MGSERPSPTFWRRLRGGWRAGEHPTPEVLAAYDAGTLAPEQEQAIQEHFLRCRECPEMLLDLKTFEEPGAAESRRFPDGWLATAWQLLLARLAGERPFWRRSLADPRTAHALCVLLLAATIGLSLWIAGLRAEIRRLGEPQINVPMEVLTATRGAASRAIVVKEGAERFVLLLDTAPAPPGKRYDSYRLEIGTAAGEPVWSGDGLVANDDGALTIELSRRLLPDGDYRMRLSGVEQRQLRMIAEHAVSLSYSPALLKR
jgi:hypothetical protein